MNKGLNLHNISILMARIALFVIYFWFGLLKVLGLSPASPLVESLFNQTLSPVLPSVSFSLFIIIFGLFEMLIGILFIIPKMERVAIVLFFLHIITTALPLFLLPDVWSSLFVPTLEGQYIIKNLALVACTLSVWSIVQNKNDKI